MQEQLRPSRQRKLEKKEKKQQEKRRKRLNAKLDRTAAFLLVSVYIIFTLLEIRDTLPGA